MRIKVKRWPNRHMSAEKGHFCAQNRDFSTKPLRHTGMKTLVFPREGGCWEVLTHPKHYRRFSTKNLAYTV